MIEEITLFAGLDEATIRLIERACRIRTYQENTIVIHQGDQTDSLYVVLSGKAVAISLDPDGKQVVLDVLRPGDYFGEMSFLDGEVRSATVMTKQPTKLIALPRSAFEEIIREHPTILLRFIEGLLHRLRKATRKIEELAFLDVYGRVARLLTECQDQEGLIQEALTHQEIAHMVGASREMVSRVMKELADKKYIKKSKGCIVVLRKLPYGMDQFL